MEKEILKLVKMINPDIQVEFQEGQLECDPIEEIVYIGYDYCEEADRLFKDFVLELNPECQYNPFLMGILHEIGHVQTYDDELDEARDEEYALMQVAHKMGLMDAATLNKEYFKIPLELNATQWAIDFAMDNRKLMNKLDKIITFEK